MAHKTSAIVTELQTRKDLSTSVQVYGITPLPAPFYQQDFVGEISAAQVRENFSTDELNDAALYNRAAWMSTYTSSFCKTALSQCDSFNMSRQLIETSISN